MRKNDPRLTIEQTDTFFRKIQLIAGPNPGDSAVHMGVSIATYYNWRRYGLPLSHYAAYDLKTAKTLKLPEPS